MVVLLTRNEPLNVVVDSGNGEGLDAWRRLVQRCDSAAATRLSGLLLGVMNWSLTWRHSSSDRVVRYEIHASETIINLRIGMVLNGLDSRPLKDRLLLNSSNIQRGRSSKQKL